MFVSRVVTLFAEGTLRVVALSDSGAAFRQGHAIPHGRVGSLSPLESLKSQTQSCTDTWRHSCHAAAGRIPYLPAADSCSPQA